MYYSKAIEVYIYLDLVTNTIRITNSLDADQDGYSVSHDLGPNCLQRLSADDKSQR